MACQRCLLFAIPLICTSSVSKLISPSLIFTADFVMEHFINTAREKIKQYGQEMAISGVNALFTLGNVVNEEDSANLYVVQKVFRGAFQVRCERSVVNLTDF